MEKFLAVLLFYTILSVEAFCQEKFYINYSYLDSTKEAGFYFKLHTPYGLYPIDKAGYYILSTKTFEKKNRINYTYCTFLVNDTSICSIADVYGHKSFIIPGDTVTISFKKMVRSNGDYPYMLNNKYRSPFFYSFNYEGKNKYIYSLFDSLAYNTGGLFSGGDIGFKESGHNLTAFFDTVTQQYNQRLKYLSLYCAKYIIPKTIHELALVEIKADYVNNLLEPLQNTVTQIDFNDYSKPYLDSLNSVNFNNPKYFFKTAIFNTSTYNYIYSYQNRLDFKENGNEESFKRMYRTINNYYNNEQIKERLLATLLIANCKRAYPSYDTVWNKFTKTFPSSIYLKHIDSLYNTEKSKTGIILTAALASSIVDNQGNTTTINKIFKNKPVLIDCWASWCLPCLQQMPDSKKLEKKYKGKVDFVYLSFDEDKSKWLEKSKALSLPSTSYLTIDNFKSKFASHFDIDAIPRYLIFDKKGHLVTADAPRPSKKEILWKILDGLIKEN